MKVPFLDLKTMHGELYADFLSRFQEIMHNAAFVGGPEVDGFEREFADFCGATQTAAVASGTDALAIAFMALGAGPGDEIITVPHTFIATCEAISQVGATIKFVDIDPKTHTLDPNALEDAITSNTVGVVPVHLYGRMCDMDPITEIAKRRGLWVVEDAAQAHGATYKGRRAGGIGDLGCFSFYPGKNLGACGEAGAIVGQSERLVQKATIFRDHGQSRKYYHDVVGVNGRMDALQAAFLRVKLPHLPKWTEQRRLAAQWYGAALEGRGLPSVDLPVEPDYSQSVFHLYAIGVDNRDRVLSAMAEAGIGVGMHYPEPVHLQRAYSHLGHSVGDFPVSERVASRTMSLPMFPGITEDQVLIVADALESAVAAEVRPFQ